MKTWLRFNLVGLAGVAVQLATLRLLLDSFHLHYLVATALAVETAVLHNFWLHWKWTWGDRNASAVSFFRFQFTTGVVSILGNVFGMNLLTGWLGIPPVAASLCSICLLYLFNYLVNDRYVFRLR